MPNALKKVPATVRLTTEEWEYARLIGRGSFSHGIGLALAYHKKREYKEPAQKKPEASSAPAVNPLDKGAMARVLIETGRLPSSCEFTARSLGLPFEMPALDDSKYDEVLERVMRIGGLSD
jgi:hypothetical protein